MVSFGINTFCCCCTTRTGSLVIGTLGWVFTLLQLLSTVDPRETSYGKHRELPNQDYTIIYIKIGYGIAALLACVLLIIGIYKKDRRYMLPWLVLKGFEAILIAILTIAVFVFACSQGIAILFLFVFICLIATVLHLYFWLCIWSHYKELEEGPVTTVTYSTTNSPPTQYLDKPRNMV